MTAYDVKVACSHCTILSDIFVIVFSKQPQIYFFLTNNLMTKVLFSVILKHQYINSDKKKKTTQI